MKRLVTAIALLLCSIPGYADDAAPSDEGRQLVDAFVSDVATMSSRFEQTLIDANGELLEISSGTLEVHRPGQFRWAYSEPYEQWLVADGLNIWSYDVDLAQVTVKPQVEALANTPALLLGGSAAALDEFEYDGDFVADGYTWVRMHPTSSDSGFKRVELAFQNREFSGMVFFDNLDQTTRVMFTDIVVNQPIDRTRFDFVAPDDVDIVGTPAVASVEDP